MGLHWGKAGSHFITIARVTDQKIRFRIGEQPATAADSLPLHHRLNCHAATCAAHRAGRWGSIKDGRVMPRQDSPRFVSTDFPTYLSHMLPRHAQPNLTRL